MDGVNTKLDRQCGIIVGRMWKIMKDSQASILKTSDKQCAVEGCSVCKCEMKDQTK